MFDLLPNLISSVITVLFPIFASYKALRTSDPAQLTPWLMYWVVFSTFSLAESWTWFIVGWLPFYAYFRLLVLSYLVLPQTQGARQIYQLYIHPFLAQHEAEIDTFITSAHDRARSAGVQYLKRAIDFIKENIFGVQPKSAPSPTRYDSGSYAQNLLSRFNLPSAREGLAAPAGDFYGLLSAAMGQLGNANKGGSSGGTSREFQAQEMSASGILLPQGLNSTADKMNFLSQQREKLKVVLSALDKEASGLAVDDGIKRDVAARMGDASAHGSGEPLQKSKSEVDFDRIEKDEVGGGESKVVSGGSWNPWTWGSKGDANNSGVHGSSTGIDSST